MEQPMQNLISPFSDKPQKIKNIFKDTFKFDLCEKTNLPMVIKKDSVGPNVPFEDVFLSGHHRVFLLDKTSTHPIGV